MAGHLDGSTGRETGNENSSLRPYPKLTSACHVGRGSDAVVNGAWGRSSVTCPKVETVSYRSPGEGGDQKVVCDLTAGPDRTKVHMNRTNDHVFCPGAGRGVDNGLSRATRSTVLWVSVFEIPFLEPQCAGSDWGGRRGDVRPNVGDPRLVVG